MKTALVYFSVLAAGTAAGALGMGSYTALVVGVVAPDVALAPDSTGAGGEVGVEAEAPSTDPDPLAIPPIDSSGTSADSGAVAIAADFGAPEAAESEAPSPTVATGEGAIAPRPPSVDSLALASNYQRLAQIFAAMSPEEAAAVLTQLDDSQLEGILMAMQSRNAAPILAEMEPLRVASVSRRVLEGRP